VVRSCHSCLLIIYPSYYGSFSEHLSDKTRQLLSGYVCGVRTVPFGYQSDEIEAFPASDAVHFHLRQVFETGEAGMLKENPAPQLIAMTAALFCPVGKPVFIRQRSVGSPFGRAMFEILPESL
jgi:hypothetical protein